MTCHLSIHGLFCPHLLRHEVRLHVRVPCLTNFLAKTTKIAAVSHDTPRQKGGPLLHVFTDGKNVHRFVAAQTDSSCASRAAACQTKQTIVSKCDQNHQKSLTFRMEKCSQICCNEHRLFGRSPKPKPPPAGATADLKKNQPWINFMILSIKNRR
jgi:hypothetical protein